MSDVFAVVRKQLDSLDAQVAVFGATVSMIRHTLDAATQATAPAVSAAPSPSARPLLPERCAAVDADACALRDGEWKSRGSFGNPRLVRCTGCDFECTGGTGE